MKNFIKLTFAFSILLALLGGCGEGSNKSVFSNETITMSLNTAYEVHEGDKVTPDGESKIVVNHVLDINTKTVTLLSGSATLLRGSYEIQ